MHSRGFVVDSRTSLASTVKDDICACCDRAACGVSLQEAVVSVELLRRVLMNPDHIMWCWQVTCSAYNTEKTTKYRWAPSYEFTTVRRETCMLTNI